MFLGAAQGILPTVAPDFRTPRLANAAGRLSSLAFYVENAAQGLFGGWHDVTQFRVGMVLGKRRPAGCLQMRAKNADLPTNGAATLRRSKPRGIRRQESSGAPNRRGCFRGQTIRQSGQSRGGSRGHGTPQNVSEAGLQIVVLPGRSQCPFWPR
jgi:hypothetical protein